MDRPPLPDGEQLGLTITTNEHRQHISFPRPRVRVELVRDADPFDPVRLQGSADVYAYLRDEVDRWDRERVLTLILNNKHILLGIEEVSVGSLTASIVHPREVFKAIILANAAAFIVAHNHPSGDPTPSKEDIDITRRLREIADLMAIRLLDHIVIGKGRYVSFVDDGYW